ncbi:unnamed protein product [Burkholderia pseudomallei]|nr:unnamed protein product [Burkholderia pseudomallei]
MRKDVRKGARDGARLGAAPGAGGFPIRAVPSGPAPRSRRTGARPSRAAARMFQHQFPGSPVLLKIERSSAPATRPSA